MDLTTRYLGFTLPHPFIVGASPLADNLDTARRLEDAGAAMVVMRSLFEEQITGEQVAAFHATHEPADSFPEALTYLPEPHDAVFGPDAYLEHLRKLRAALGVPVVASLNGTTRGGWLDYAQLIEQAGASALELNVYDLATSPDCDAASVERETVEMVREIKRTTSLRLAVKLSPFYTSLPHFCRQLDAAGADALILFNRFYQPDIDVEELDVVPRVNLSDSSELLLRIRWLAILSGQFRADLAVTGGVHTALDAVKATMCGAAGIQLVSALLINGPDHLRTIHTTLTDWLVEHEYDSLNQMRGSMNLLRCPDPRAFERANYMRVLLSW